MYLGTGSHNFPLLLPGNGRNSFSCFPAITLVPQINCNDKTLKGQGGTTIIVYLTSPWERRQQRLCTCNGISSPLLPHQRSIQISDGIKVRRCTAIHKGAVLWTDGPGTRGKVHSRRRIWKPKVHCTVTGQKELAGNSISWMRPFRISQKYGTKSTEHKPVMAAEGRQRLLKRANVTFWILFGTGGTVTEVLSVRAPLGGYCDWLNQTPKEGTDLGIVGPCLAGSPRDRAFEGETGSAQEPESGSQFANTLEDSPHSVGFPTLAVWPKMNAFRTCNHRSTLGSIKGENRTHNRILTIMCSASWISTAAIRLSAKNPPLIVMESDILTKTLIIATGPDKSYRWENRVEKKFKFTLVWRFCTPWSCWWWQVRVSKINKARSLNCFHFCLKPLLVN